MQISSNVLIISHLLDVLLIKLVLNKALIIFYLSGL
ncbi:MAG: hypothetical protein PWQ43_1559 [Rikenellaceae bacterium]|jgi:hypothetical protein|nr:hypothetical protein [Rikenellaceae bacterium]